jgi:hypothetical protein
VDNILSHLNDIKEHNRDEFLAACWCFRDDFLDLLQNPSTFLPDFLDNLFYVSTQKGLHRFGLPLKRLPMVCYCNNEVIQQSMFLAENNNDTRRQTMIDYKVLPIAIDMVYGSSGSLQLLESLSHCGNQQIHRSALVQTLIRSRWNDFWFFIFLLTLLNWANLSIMIALIVNGSDPHSGLFVTYGILTAILFFYEVLQAAFGGIKEYINVWNLIDMCRTACNVVWMILVAYYGESEVTYVSYIMCIFNFFRGLSGFRVFESTRFYVRLIIEVCINVTPFIAVFLYTTLFFGMLNYSSGLQWRNMASNGVFYGIWKTPMELNMGNFSNSLNPDLNFLYFMLCSIINVIIMINLIVSILGDSYDKFQAENAEIGNMEMADLAIEIETLMIWRRRQSKQLYLQVCTESKNEGITDQWAGKLSAISQMIKKNKTQAKTNFVLIRKKLDEIDRKLSLK